MTQTPHIGVAYSGGKDSAYALWMAAESGRQVTAITVDTGFLPAVAHRNILSAPAKLGVSQVIVRKPGLFKAIYRRHVPRIADDPMAICRECHDAIDSEVLACAERIGCTEVWSGITDDTLAAVGGGTAREYARETGFVAPHAAGDYNAERIARRVRELGLIETTSPMATNCDLNVVIAHRCMRARRPNPYAAMLSWWQRALIWATYWSGALRCMSERVTRRLRRDSEP